MRIWRILYRMYQKDGREFITELYREILNREAEPSAVLHYTGMLNSGTSKTSLVNAILSSQEATNILVSPTPPVPNGAERIIHIIYRILRMPDVDFVTEAYRQLLGRHPEPAGSANYLDLLENGTLKIDIIKGILSSSEAHRLTSGGEATNLIDELDLANIKNSKSYRIAFETPKPLVTVCIATYNRANLLRDRSLKSVVRQTYVNLQIIVIGDCCTDDTEDVIRTFNDSRIYFENQQTRGSYPANPVERWMVAGTGPVNRALELASGDFITHIDDDDEFTLDRIEKLVGYITTTKADFVFHPFWWEGAPDQWVLNPAETLDLGQVTTSSVFYHQWFKQVPWDINAYKYNEPGDWNRFKKVKQVGAKITRFPEPLTRKYFHEVTV